jgi:putative spermidine/putrescine transport system permease protein
VKEPTPGPAAAKAAAAPAAMPRGAARRWAGPGAAYLVLPLLVFQILAFALPQLNFYRFAFGSSDFPGDINMSNPSLENLTSVVTDAHHRELILRTLEFGALVVLVCLVLGFPLAYVIARSRFWRTPLLAIVIVTSFTSVIVRVLGWRVILGDQGPVNDLLTLLPFVEERLRLVNNMTGMVIGTANAVMPFMVLLLIPVIDQVKPDLERAAAGLGASRGKVVRKVLLPGCRPGLIGGGLLTFAYAMGSFTTPSLLGSTGSQVLSVAIREQVNTTVDYPFAAALAITLMILVLVVAGVASILLSRTHRVQSAP